MPTSGVKLSVGLPTAGAGGPPVPAVVQSLTDRELRKGLSAASSEGIHTFGLGTSQSVPHQAHTRAKGSMGRIAARCGPRHPHRPDSLPTNRWAIGAVWPCAGLPVYSRRERRQNDAWIWHAINCIVEHDVCGLITDKRGDGRFGLGRPWKPEQGRPTARSSLS